MAQQRQRKERKGRGEIFRPGKMGHRNKERRGKKDHAAGQRCLGAKTSNAGQRPDAHEAKQSARQGRHGKEQMPEAGSCQTHEALHARKIPVVHRPVIQSRCPPILR